MNSAEASLSFVEILKYLDADNASRCIMEGERIINANHLITCGLTESSATSVKLFALCLRTSSLTSKPHAITGSFKLENENFKIEKFVCTCTAGEGEACKHITATLIFCNRNSITKLQKLSSTDVQCIWTQKKKDVLLPYIPVPLQDACCSKKPDWLVEKEPVGTETMLYYRSELLAACPDSALAKHQKRVSEASKECSNVFQSESESFQPVRLAFSTFEPVGGADPSLSPIIFLHGLTAFKETWGEIPQVVANASKRLSYTVDARNHGDSDWSEQFNFDLNVDDLLHFMDSRGIQKAVLVGHSMGGITVIKSALRKPDRIEKIVVEDMFVRKMSPPVMDTVTMYVTFLRKALEEAPGELDELETKKFVLKYILEQMSPEMRELASSGRSDFQDSHIRYLSFQRGADGRFASKCNLSVIERALRNTDTISSDPEGQFRGPACFIYGKMSPFLVGADEHHIKQFFPEAILEGIDEVGHDVHNLKPLEFTDVLLKFLS